MALKLLYSVEDYGAVHDGKTVGDGAITSGLKALTSATAPFSAGDVGKIVVVAGAGVAGAALKTTIAAYVSASQVTLTASASTTVTGKKVDWGTDDTSAIQNAINACISGGGGTLYFPNGIYIINGALYTGGTNPNSQLYFPSSSMVQTRVSINLLGESNVTMAGTYISGEITTSGVILQSTLIASEVSGTTPSILSTLTSATVANGSTYNENWNYISMQNMGFRTYTNGGQTHKMGAVNLGSAAKVSSRNCSFLADYSVDSMASPSGSSTFGFIVCAGNDWAPNVIEENYAGGFEFGFAFGEHTTVDSIYSIGNYYGAAFFTGQYAITGKILTHACVSQLYFQGVSTLLGVPSIANRVNVDIFLEAEQVGTALWWGATTFHTDTNNYAYGKISYGGYQPSPIWDTFTGGSHLMKTPWEVVLPKRFSSFGPVSITGGWLAQTTHHVLELGPNTATSNDTTYHHILITAANQTGTSNIIAQRFIYNYATSFGLPLFEETGLTDGSVNQAKVTEGFNTAGANIVALTKRPTGYTFGVPLILPQYASDAAADAASAGGSAPKGTVYYNTTTDKVKVKENATWKTITTT